MANSKLIVLLAFLRVIVPLLIVVVKGFKPEKTNVIQQFNF